MERSSPYVLKHIFFYGCFCWKTHFLGFTTNENRKKQRNFSPPWFWKNTSGGVFSLKVTNIYIFDKKKKLKKLNYLPKFRKMYFSHLSYISVNCPRNDNLTCCTYSEPKFGCLNMVWIIGGRFSDKQIRTLKVKLRVTGSVQSKNYDNFQFYLSYSVVVICRYSVRK